MSDGPQEAGYALRFKRFPHYFHAIATVNTTTEDSFRGYMKEAALVCRESQYQRLLLVNDVQRVIPDITLFNLAQDTILWFHGIRTAWVTLEPACCPAMEFFTHVGANRGAIYEHFTCIGDAKVWLLSVL